jgi:hypothetical protein
MTSEVSDWSGLASIRRITLEEAWSLTSEGKAVLVDTRPSSYYRGAHAEGAISMPFEDIRRDPRTAIDALPPDQLIVFTRSSSMSISGKLSAPSTSTASPSTTPSLLTSPSKGGVHIAVVVPHDGG